MSNSSARKIKKRSFFLIATASIFFIVSEGLKAQPFVQDKHISLSAAKKMVEQAKVNSKFPIVVNDFVLAELNFYLGTPEGRGFMRASLARMENYHKLVTSQLKEHKLPEELKAIPIVESGYQNIGKSLESPAGLWQFTTPTARRFGLRIDGKVDERLNEKLETGAAMRYLEALYDEFKDWQLAVLAYNVGGGTVQQKIKETGSRDVWTLIKKSHESNKTFLAKIMAVIIIMKNPSSIE